MTSLADHHSTSIVKLLLLGDAKVGKTGSLVSLVAAGYKLRILDFDNLLDYFYQLVKERCPDRLGNVDYRTLRDPIRAGSSGAVISGKPAAWINAIKMLDSWKYDDIDLGVPSTWDADTILVIDSLSRLCDAAYDFHEATIPKGKSGEVDGRAIYGNAQDDVEKVIGMLTARSFNTNVIVICHGVYQTLPDGSTRIFPQGVGQKLSPKIPQYFPNYVKYKMDGQGKRTIQLESDNMIALGAARKLPNNLDPSTGLADFFAAFRAPPTTNTTKSTVLPLQRKIT
jgi:hypothetical protein